MRYLGCWIKIFVIVGLSRHFLGVFDFGNSLWRYLLPLILFLAVIGRSLSLGAQRSFDKLGSRVHKNAGRHTHGNVLYRLQFAVGLYWILDLLVSLSLLFVFWFRLLPNRFALNGCPFGLFRCFFKGMVGREIGLRCGLILIVGCAASSDKFGSGVQVNVACEGDGLLTYWKNCAHITLIS